MQREKRMKHEQSMSFYRGHAKQPNMHGIEVPRREKMKKKGRKKMMMKILKHNEGLETVTATGSIYPD